MSSLVLACFALLVPSLHARDDTGLLQANLAPSENSEIFDLVDFHGQATYTSMHDILGLVGKHARKVSDAGRRPTLIHIGANLLDNSVRWSDLHLWGEAQKGLSRAGVPPHAYRLLLDEPRSSTHDYLRGQLNKLGLTEEGDSDIEHALIMGNCPAPTVTMYGPSERLRNHSKWNAIDSWSSMDKDHFYRVVNGLRKERLKSAIDQSYALACADEVVRLEPDQSKWLEERQTKCLSGLELLASRGADSRDVSMLVVDAEGADFGIVREFLKVETFAPALIQFEGFWPVLKDDPLLEELRSRGYAAGTLTWGLAARDADNIYAVRLSA